MRKAAAGSSVAVASATLEKWEVNDIYDADSRSLGPWVSMKQVQVKCRSRVP